MGSNDNHKKGSFFGGIGLHLLCCGIPVLFILIGTAGISSFFAFIFEQWWLIPVVLSLVVLIWFLIRKKKNQNCKL